MRHAAVQITHPDRVLFPDTSAKGGITKGDLADYYREVAGQRDPWADMTRHSHSLDDPIKRVAKLRA